MNEQTSADAAGRGSDAPAQPAMDLSDGSPTTSSLQEQAIRQIAVQYPGLLEKVDPNPSVAFEILQSALTREGLYGAIDGIHAYGAMDGIFGNPQSGPNGVYLCIRRGVPGGVHFLAPEQIVRKGPNHQPSCPQPGHEDAELSFMEPKRR